MRISRQSVWTIISIGVAILIAVGGWWFTREVRSLRVEILSNSPIISLSSDTPPGIQVLYNGRSIQTLSLILLRIQNTGNRPIIESDFSEAINITLSNGAEVGGAMVQQTLPAGIPLTPTIVAPNRIQLARALLNPGDTVVLRILAVNNDTTLDIAGRIAGISQIEVATGITPANSIQETRANISNIFLIVILILLVIVALIVLWWSTPVIKWRQQHLGLDPASVYYTAAQYTMLNPLTPGADRLGAALGSLKQAFIWDNNYVHRAEVDPAFSQLRDYEPFKALVAKYKQQGEQPSTPKNSN